MAWRLPARARLRHTGKAGYPSNIKLLRQSRCETVSRSRCETEFLASAGWRRPEPPMQRGEDGFATGGHADCHPGGALLRTRSYPAFEKILQLCYLTLGEVEQSPSWPTRRQRTQDRCRATGARCRPATPIHRNKEIDITYAKPLRAAIGGAVAIVAANMVSNILFFQIGRPILFENELQSAKVIAVLFEIEPLPLMFTNGPLYMAVAAVIGVIHGLVFFWIEPALPRGIILRGASFAVILWALMALYFEFHTPFNMFGEPPALVAVELAFWVPVTLVQGLVLSVVYGRGRHELASAVE
jgi:hypothetical protein